LHSNVNSKILIYGGKQQQERSNGIVVQPWDKLFEA
jgi:hypothetical protein